MTDINKAAPKTKPEPDVREPVYLVSGSVLQDLMRYLMSRPYGEVVKLMSILARLSQLDPNISPSFVKRPQDEKSAKNKPAQ